MSEANPPKRKQHETPCAACPFSKTCKPYADDRAALGNSSPFVYVGQANGSFTLPCHSTHDYTQLEERLAAAQPGSGCECAGAAIFRANIGLRYAERLLHLPANLGPDSPVFGSFTEFVAHHYKIPIDTANMIVHDLPPDLLTAIEVSKVQFKARVQPGSVIIAGQPKGG